MSITKRDVQLQNFEVDIAGEHLDSTKLELRFNLSLTSFQAGIDN